MPLNATRVMLDNGVTVIAKSNHTTPAVSTLVGIRTGAFADPSERDGTAALCARVLDRGTVTRSADAIADDLDGRGASLSVIAGRHQMALAATCLSDDFSAVLSLVADVARHPAFADTEIATRRDNLITSIRQEEDNPASMAADAFALALYGAHPYARKVRGTVAGVEAVRRQDLVRFHQRGFDPAAITVVVVGDVDEGDAIQSVATLFAGWAASATAPGDPPAAVTPAGTRPAIVVPDAPLITGRNLVAVPMMNKAQADVVYGFPGIRRSHPDYTAYSVMNNALGQYAIGGRLGDSIRERQGMAYYVYSSLDASFGPGPFSIRAGVAAANVEKTIASIDTEIASICQQGFTAQEIDESKSYMIGALPRQLETNAGIAAFLLNLDAFDLGLDYDERLPGLIGAVTKDSVDAAASQLLDPARATIAVAGPWAPTSMIAGSQPRPSTVRAVFFDVDFTLIFPGPMFQAEGYRRACAAHGILVDPAKFDEATAASSFILDEVEEQIYNHDIFIHYTASIIEKMGGRGANVVEVASEIYDQWSVNHHFELYDDVAPVLERLQKRGLLVGAISNSHRSLDAFREHFSLANVITVSVSGAEHGYMKPHRSIFDAALARAKVSAGEAMMVGDSFKHDIEGALNAGWRAVLLRRSGEVPYALPSDLPVITTLPDLLPLLT